MPASLQPVKKYFTTRQQLFIIFLIANIISCKYNEKINNELNTGNLIMEVSPLQLNPTSTAITVSFRLAEPGQNADLSKFQLKVRITKQEGGTGSKLSYQDAAGNPSETVEVDESLSHFTSLSNLDVSNSPLKIDFKVIPGEKVTLLIYEIEAFDAADNLVGRYPVEYKAEKQKKLATLTRESAKQLEGEQKEIELKLHNLNTEAIPAGTIKIQIICTEELQARIVGSQPTATPHTYEIIINEEIASKQILAKTLIIDPKNESRASFNIYLIDQEENQTIPISVSWREKAIQIYDLAAFVGNNEASLRLYSALADIHAKQLTIEIGSNNKAKFTLIRQDNNQGGANLTLDQLIGSDTIPAKQKTTPVRFKLLHANGEESSQVTIHIKQGAQELATQTITWRAEKFSLNISSELGINWFSDQDLYTLNLQNMGDVIDMSRIKLRLINNNNVAFKIGNFSTNSTVDIDLKAVTGRAQLGDKEVTKFNLQQDATVTTDAYNTFLLIELLDEQGISLGRLNLEWINQAKIATKLDSFPKDLNVMKKDFENNMQAATEASKYDNKKKEVVKNIITFNKKLRQSIIELSTIVLVERTTERKEEIQTKLIPHTQQLIKATDKKIIDFLEKARERIRQLTQQIKSNIEALQNNSTLQDKFLLKFIIDQKRTEIYETLDYIADTANAYKNKKTKDIANSARKIVKEAQVAINKLEEVANTETK